MIRKARPSEAGLSGPTLQTRIGLVDVERHGSNLTLRIDNHLTQEGPADSDCHRSLFELTVSPNFRRSLNVRSMVSIPAIISHMLGEPALAVQDWLRR
jgi:hypothetical protein